MPQVRPHLMPVFMPPAPTLKTRTAPSVFSGPTPPTSVEAPSTRETPIEYDPPPIAPSPHREVDSHEAAPAVRPPRSEPPAPEPPPPLKSEPSAPDAAQSIQPRKRVPPAPQSLSIRPQPAVLIRSESDQITPAHPQSTLLPSPEPPRLEPQTPAPVPDISQKVQTEDPVQPTLRPLSDPPQPPVISGPEAVPATAAQPQPSPLPPPIHLRPQPDPLPEPRSIPVDAVASVTKEKSSPQIRPAQPKDVVSDILPIQPKQAAENSSPLLQQKDLVQVTPRSETGQVISRPSVTPGQDIAPQPQRPAESASSPTAIAQVQPTLTRSDVIQAPRLKYEPPSPNIQVSIGTVDLRIAPPTPPPAPRKPRRSAHGFEAYRRLRDYGGWER